MTEPTDARTGVTGGVPVAGAGVPVRQPDPVVVEVDGSQSSLDAVAAAARRAARLGVPLEIRIDNHAELVHDLGRAQLIQRLDLAVEVARAAEPDLVVRLPAGDPFPRFPKG